MTNRVPSQPTDAAALAASALAGVLAVFIEPGPYNLLSVITGVTLLSVVLAYQTRCIRTLPQTIAFAFVVAFIALLPFGYIAEWHLATGSELGTCPTLASCKPSELESRVSDNLLTTTWGVMALMVGIVDWRAQKH